MNSELSIRQAAEEDIPRILSFIKKIAAYEKLSHEVIATEDILRKSLFGEKPGAEVVFGYVENEPVAYAVYFYNFSTFIGKKGLYLEDLFVLPELRGKGVGKKMLLYLVQKAMDEKCGRMEWAVLDWNEPAINFYRSLGAKAMDEWTTFRLDEEALKKIDSR
ncbi:MAG: GNAT family N-acetyltransferase [Ignavibacteria bacterium CG_4_8_14_3_um_filter_37_9]|nr:GNAT family N-acetyltransferase [Ignavibacteria bacterium]OIO13673.1 MAG: GNAT family N-acetyltransferase [Ignavibacteria bacterium CG1_02_37_35]PIP77414.1 MAG: GNAT family N-acetyltransferase [Ignavibacteria bacterium CG22_combo_CG10-13_8_21_14_all_37_15]PIS44417.1 MAG: GNAT family N-acetyltransferase [Ignavibacteria bacterium CG08_land_8_20_14_0_20_37_9]PIX00080.1 MAG: GNAT family N-acetyltransferase [Ignavibacteria bacterium CG_4_8_14_3_um_filter_37_9]PIX92917.1 MAG: GNAT family N-acetyl